MSSQVVFTNKARCRDCYRCVRVCPVKAIRMQKSQAFVVEERCIACGTCIRECPQGAKSFRQDLESAELLLKSPGIKVASVAPSFVALFPEWEQKRLPSALRRLGFDRVEETAIGAFHVAQESKNFIESHDRSHICTACPAIVNYVEHYESEKKDLLVPVVSPMIAHARLIKEQAPQAKVIFFGPCVAKKSEAEWPQNQGMVDCVLTFTELYQWLERAGVDLARMEESRFDGNPCGDARLFPLVGGMLRTATLSTDPLSEKVLSVSGFEEVQGALDGIAEQNRIVEPMFCPQGCINGPCLPDDRGVYRRRQDVLRYAQTNRGSERTQSLPLSLATSFVSGKVDEDPHSKEVTEEEIRQVLERSGKAKAEDQLNCGSCGYHSCREKAVAVIRGMAEVEMCIPSMRRLAEQRSDRIMESSPNGIVILDERLQIIGMNPAFRRFFMCSEAVYGRKISYLMDPEPFERLAAGEEDLIELTVEHNKYNLVFHQLLYPLPENHQYVGIFVNITDSRASQEKLEQMKDQTIKQARELLDHQIRMAQGIAKYIGESTARTEELVHDILNLASDRQEGIWEASTSK